MAKAIVRGDREIIRNLRRSANSVGGRFMDQALRHSLEPLKDRAEQNAAKLRNFVGKYSSFFPQPTTGRRGGHLDQGVAIGRQFARGQFHRVYWVAFRKRARKLAHLVEYGTAPHFQPNFKGGFQHPGSSPRPFFRPAFEAEKHEVLREVSIAVWRRINAAAIGGRK